MKRIPLFILLFASLASEGQRRPTVNGQVYAPVYDTSAKKFFDSAGITDPVIKAAVNTLVIKLKDSSFWAVDREYYPLVGGTLRSCSRGLKNPSAAAAISFPYGATFSANGVKYDGLFQYGATTIQADYLAQNDNHISVYSRTDTSTTDVDMGIEGVGGSGFFSSIELYSGVAYSYNFVSGASAYLTGTATRTDGLFISSRTSSTAVSLSRNATDRVTGSISSLSPTSQVYYVGASHYGTVAGLPCHKQHAWYSFGAGMTAAEETTFNNIIAEFQTALGRATP